MNRRGNVQYETMSPKRFVELRPTEHRHQELPLTNLLSLTLASNHLATLPCNLSMALHAMPRITIGSTR